MPIETDPDMESLRAILGQHYTSYDYEADSMGMRNGRDQRSYAVTDAGIAIIPVQGTLMKKAYGLWAMSGCSSYEKISAQFQAAMQDSAVRGIMLDIDSPGGETHGVFELSEMIASMRGTKPVYAAANDLAASAAYGIASGADKIFVTRTGCVGSIGIYSVHCDESGWDEKAGLKYTYIYAGEKKVDGNPHEELSKSAKSDAQAEVDRQYGIFVATVAKNRKKSDKQITDTQAGCLFAEAAVPLLADYVGTIDDAMAALEKKIKGTSVRVQMAEAPIAPVVATPPSAAAASTDPEEVDDVEDDEDTDDAPPPDAPDSPDKPDDQKSTIPSEVTTMADANVTVIPAASTPAAQPAAPAATSTPAPTPALAVKPHEPKLIA
jgi:signal peptide peptidase SppA